MVKTIVIKSGSQLKIWNHSVLERLIILLKQNGVEDILLETPPGLNHKLQAIPGNLVCSNLFIQEFLSANKDFDTFANSTKRAFTICKETGSLKIAEKKIFRDSKKATDGWVSKNINARISIPLSRLLARFPIHPNLVTLLNLPLVLLSPWLFMQPGYYYSVMAGVVFQLASIFDGCDGEIARTKLQVTRLGGWLDTAMDNLSYLLFFFAVGFWQAKTHQNQLYLNLLACVLIFFFFALLLTYIGMMTLGTQTHHAYRSALENLFSRAGHLRALNLLSPLSKRENFALGILFLCLINQREMIYWLILSGLSLYCVIVCVTFPFLYKQLKGGV